MDGCQPALLIYQHLIVLVVYAVRGDQNCAILGGNFPRARPGAGDLLTADVVLFFFCLFACVSPR